MVREEGMPREGIRQQPVRYSPYELDLESNLRFPDPSTISAVGSTRSLLPMPIRIAPNQKFSKPPATEASSGFGCDTSESVPTTVKVAPALG